MTVDEFIEKCGQSGGNERANAAGGGEAKGQVRWLRPDLQAPGYVARPSRWRCRCHSQSGRRQIFSWPRGLAEQVVAVASAVSRAAHPVAANDLARAVKGRRAVTVVPVLDTLAGMGRLRKLEDGRYAA